MTVPDDSQAYEDGGYTPDTEEVKMIVSIRCDPPDLEDEPSVRRQLDFFERRFAEMMPVWHSQYKEYLDVGFGLKEP